LGWGGAVASDQKHEKMHPFDEDGTMRFLPRWSGRECVEIPAMKRCCQMSILPKFEHILLLLGLLGLAVGLATESASAISVDVAKRCEALTAKAYPPRQVGNPAAGSAKGNGRSELEYFRKCVANADNGRGAQ
jgi:hypothetical protein